MGSSRLEGLSPRALGTNPRAIAKAERAALNANPKTQLGCAMCGARHSGYHPCPGGPWPYCCSAYCRNCCPHRLAGDDPKTWDDTDRMLHARAKDVAKRLREEGLL